MGNKCKNSVTNNLKEMRGLDSRLKNIESQKWSKTQHFWTGLLGLPIFLILGNLIDFYSDNPHIIKLFHDGIGTVTVIENELKYNPSPLRKSILEVVTSDIMKPSETYVEAFELGVINENQLANCVRNSIRSTENNLSESSRLETQEDEDSSQTYESSNNCQSIKKEFKNSLFSIQAENIVDIKIGIGVSEVTFANIKESTPIYANITEKYTHENLLKEVKFSFGDGNDINLTKDVVSLDYKFGLKTVKYKIFVANSVILPETSLKSNFMRILNTRIEPNLPNNIKVSVLIMISPTESKGQPGVI